MFVEARECGEVSSSINQKWDQGIWRNLSELQVGSWEILVLPWRWTCFFLGGIKVSNLRFKFSNFEAFFKSQFIPTKKTAMDFYKNCFHTKLLNGKKHMKTVSTSGCQECLNANLAWMTSSSCPSLSAERQQWSLNEPRKCFKDSRGASAK